MKRLLITSMMAAVGFLASQSMTAQASADDLMAAEASTVDGDGAVGVQAVKERGNRKGKGKKGEKGERPGERRERPSPEQMLERLDGNGDQMLSQEELPEPLQQRMEKLDADGDGLVSLQELKAAAKHFAKGRRGPGGEGMDGKGDRPARGDRNPGRMLEKLDADKDGKLSKAELPEKLQSRFEKMDVNSDGFLDRSDFEAMAAKRGQGKEKGKGKGKAGKRGQDRNNQPVVPEMPTEDFQP